VNLLAAINTAGLTVELFSAALFAIAYFHRTSDAEHGIAAVVGVAAACHAGAALAGPHASSLWAEAAVGFFAHAGLALAVPAAAHFVIAYRGAERSWRSIAAMYSVGAAAAAWDVFEAGASSGFVWTARSGADLVSAGLASDCVALVAAVATVVIAAHAYLEGRKEGLGVVIGATAFLATSLHDVAVQSHILSSGLLVDAGFGAFVAGIAGAQSARFSGVTRELDRRTRELRSRTSELGRSYEDLRAAQEELVKKEQLAVVGELAAVIAHEVRNPLAIIANAVSGLRKQISRQDHETLLAILDEETSRLNRLVTDLLRYARPVSVQRSDFSLADVLERALSLAAQDRGTIRTELRLEGHDGRVYGDSNLLRQVFDNLVVNAVQAMGAMGTVTVRVRAASEDGVEGAAIDIIDTGEGMDTQVRTRARDPFFTTRPSGTGLGLAIVDRIVDAHGGRLAIESRSGEGTTVTVFLPNGSANEPVRRRSSPPAGPGLGAPPRSGSRALIAGTLSAAAVAGSAVLGSAGMGGGGGATPLGDAGGGGGGAVGGAGDTAVGAGGGGGRSIGVTSGPRGGGAGS
jgi:signal transduction histidine kinase